MESGRAFSRRALLRGAAATGVATAFTQLASCSTPDERPDTAGIRRVAGSTQPNVIVVLADDMRFDEVQYMPNVVGSLADAGTSFTAARHNISLCSPARAGFLTGQYSIRHGVRSQADAFRAKNDETKTLAVWMHEAGYDTGIIGKYFTPREASGSPPGWNTRRQLTGANQEQYGFSVWDGSSISMPAQDQSSYLRSEARSFIRNAREPFFLWFTPTANHSPFQTPPGYEDVGASLVWPDRREVDVSDKPAWIQSLPALSDEELDAVRLQQVVRVQELAALDDAIAEMLVALDERGSVDNTIIAFSSDNGMLRGEHRLPAAKNLPYEPSVRVPCIVRGPGFPVGQVDVPVHMAIDLTAMCTDVAGATPDLALDGVSLVDVAAGPSRYADRQLLYDRDNRDDPRRLDCPPAVGIFTQTRKLIRYGSVPPTHELYDLALDPDELANVYEVPAYAADRARLTVALDALLG